jgi:hypothetical protein
MDDKIGISCFCNFILGVIGTRKQGNKQIWQFSGIGIICFFPNIYCLATHIEKQQINASFRNNNLIGVYHITKIVQIII